MSYKNKTYVMFDADTDIGMYRLMTAWKANSNIEFNFHDAHELNNLRGTASEEQIKRKLKERLKNTKQAVLLVGENTKNLHKFVRWEIDVAMKMDIPIIAVNLCKSNSCTVRTPPILKNNAYFVSVPFDQKKIKYALDEFPNEYHKKKSEAPSDRRYDWNY